MKLEIKNIEGKVLVTVEEKDFNKEKPLMFHLFGGKENKEKIDVKYLKGTGKGKLVLN